MKIERAIISVSDKTGLEDLVKCLHKLGVEMISTGGTAKAIADLGIPVKDVSDYTGFPEMLNGRVKTLHPKIHGGILAIRDNKEHMETLKGCDIGLIDMVVVNLYPFEKTTARRDVKIEEAIENIDIGGPSMLRSAAKNCKSVCVICDVSDYRRVIEEMRETSGCVSDALLADLGIKAFARTSAYDAAIHDYLRSQKSVAVSKKSDFPEALILSCRKLQDLRYGENPHQRAAFYKDARSDEAGVTTAMQLCGKELSFNNIMDLNAALEIVKEFSTPAAAIVKHMNPCGAATARTLKQAYLDALDCDRMSAFGGIVGFNASVNGDIAGTIMKEADFVECVIAPSYTADALKILKVRKNLRLLEVKGFATRSKKTIWDMKKVMGGLLVQDEDIVGIEEADLKCVTKRRPTKAEIESLVFAALVVKHVRSNAIVLCQGMKTVGIGAGQMSRVDSVVIAVRKAANRAKGSALASDAFFPKEDGIEEAARAGVTSIIQPGGSIRDPEVIKKANEFGIAMVFTGIRHFKH